MKKYPFQLITLTNAIPFLSKKKHDASLAALRWNKEIPDFYPLYAFRALEIGGNRVCQRSHEFFKENKSCHVQGEFEAV